MKKIYYSSRFEKRYLKLPKRIQGKAEKKEEFFRENPFHRGLRTHKLSGRLAGLWSFSIDRRYRVVFEFLDRGSVVFHTVGDHSVYKRI